MRPTLRCVLVSALGIPVALLAAVMDERLWVVWVAYVGVFVVGCLIDILFGLRRRDVVTTLETPDTIYIGAESVMTFTLSSARGRGVSVTALPELGNELEHLDARDVVLAPPAARLTFPLRPLRRGERKVEAIWIRWRGPLGLMQRQRRDAFDRTIAVVPNTAAVRDAAVQLFARRQFESGLKVERYVGDGSEFESLRDYVPGLDHRSMNWKATARHRTLVCTQFRAERNHQVVLALDAGHLMSEPMDGLPKLDHAINTSLLMSYACLRTGDQVGWYSFDEKPRGFLQPAGGVSSFPRLKRFSAGIEYSTGETNYTLGITDLSTRLRRRSLVVVLTDFVDSISAELMVENLGRLARRHLVVFVALRDASLDAQVSQRPDDIDSAYRSVVAADFVKERDLALRRLQQTGVLCVDAPPARVSNALINRYLEIKRRELF